MRTVYALYANGILAPHRIEFQIPRLQRLMTSNAAENHGITPPQIVAIYVLGLVSLLFSVWAVTRGWYNSIYDFHGFRQAQTMLAAQSIRDGGSVLRYETPVFGPPWTFPMEFPTYEALVGYLSRLFSTPLDQTGRFVSVAFYYLSYLPLASIMGRLGLRRVLVMPTLAVFAASPFYVFMSRLVLMESTALFFSLIYLDSVLALWTDREVNSRFWRHTILAAVCGMLASMTKVTTFTPYWVLAVGIIAWKLGKQRPCTRRDVFRFGAITLAWVLLPAAATGLWVRFSDAIKRENPITVNLTSGALKTWNFGTLHQRLQFHEYWRFRSAITTFVGSNGLLLLILIVAAILAPRTLRFFLFCVTMYFITIEIFFNLHYVHQYYDYANAVFIIAGVGYILANLIELPDKGGWIGVVLLALTLMTCGYTYRRGYYELQTTNAPGKPAAAALIDRMTRPDQLILVFGWGYSSELPYQSHRRAIMASRPESIGGLESVIDGVGRENIGMVVACYGPDPRLASTLHKLAMPASTVIHVDGCDLYRRSPV